jgi:hypothetical protein
MPKPSLYVPTVLLGLIPCFLAQISTVSAQITIQGPTARAVFQRDATNRATIPLLGTYLGAAERIEARAVRAGDEIAPWQEIDRDLHSGKFAGTLTLPAGGWYDIEVRGRIGSTVTPTTQIQRVGVGDVFITAGQSNAANHGLPRQTADDRVSALVNWTTGVWRQGNDPQPLASGSDGSPWPSFANELVAKHDMPIGLISIANGGTSVVNWLPGDTLYSRLRDALKFVGPNGARAILWHQGESDAIDSTSTPVYLNRLQTIIAQSRIDAGWSIPWGVARASYHPDSTTAEQAAIVAAQQQVIDADPHVFAGASTNEFHQLGYLRDNVHFNGAGLAAHGKLWAQAVEKYFATVPEPAAASLLGVGAVAAGGIAQRRNRQK